MENKAIDEKKFTTTHTFKIDPGNGVLESFTGTWSDKNDAMKFYNKYAKFWREVMHRELIFITIKYPTIKNHKKKKNVANRRTRGRAKKDSIPEGVKA